MYIYIYIYKCHWLNTNYLKQNTAASKMILTSAISFMKDFIYLFGKFLNAISAGEMLIISMEFFSWFSIASLACVKVWNVFKVNNKDTITTPTGSALWNKWPHFLQKKLYISSSNSNTISSSLGIISICFPGAFALFLLVQLNPVNLRRTLEKYDTCNHGDFPEKSDPYFSDET